MFSARLFVWKNIHNTFIERLSCRIIPGNAEQRKNCGKIARHRKATGWIAGVIRASLKLLERKRRRVKCGCSQGGSRWNSGSCQQRNKWSPVVLNEGNGQEHWRSFLMLRGRAGKWRARVLKGMENRKKWETEKKLLIDFDQLLQPAISKEGSSWRWRRA